MAGKSFPWKYIDGYYLRVRLFTRFAEMEGDSVGSGVLGVYGVINAELPNPDVNPEQRIVSVLIEHRATTSPCTGRILILASSQEPMSWSLCTSTGEAYFGRRKPSIYVACYPAGTWQGFSNAVEKYASAEFRWPEPFFLYAPSPNAPFPPLRKVLQKIYFLHEPEHHGSSNMDCDHCFDRVQCNLQRPDNGLVNLAGSCVTSGELAMDKVGRRHAMPRTNERQPERRYRDPDMSSQS